MIHHTQNYEIQIQGFKHYVITKQMNMSSYLEMLFIFYFYFYFF